MQGYDIIGDIHGCATFCSTMPGAGMGFVWNDGQCVGCVMDSWAQSDAANVDPARSNCVSESGPTDLCKTQTAYIYSDPTKLPASAMDGAAFACPSCGKKQPLGSCACGCCLGGSSGCDQNQCSQVITNNCAGGSTPICVIAREDHVTEEAKDCYQPHGKGTQSQPQMCQCTCGFHDSNPDPPIPTKGMSDACGGTDAAQFGTTTGCTLSSTYPKDTCPTNT